MILTSYDENHFIFRQPEQIVEVEAGQKLLIALLGHSVELAQKDVHLEDFFGIKAGRSFLTFSKIPLNEFVPIRKEYQNIFIFYDAMKSNMCVVNYKS